jgi:hypothetical protein
MNADTPTGAPVPGEVATPAKGRGGRDLLGRLPLILLLVFAVLALPVADVTATAGPDDPVTTGSDDPAAVVPTSNSAGVHGLAGVRETAREAVRAAADAASASTEVGAAQAGAEWSGASSAPGSIAGTVRTNDGTALADICVAAFTAPFEQDGLVAGTMTDAAGRYVLADLASDTYRLLFLDCGEETTHAYEWFPDRSTYMAAEPIELGSDEHLTGADARLALGVTIAGTVRDAASRAPAAGICAASVDELYQVMDFVITDGSGAYTLAGLRAGEHRVAFLDCNDPPAYATEWWDAAPSFLMAEALVLSAGQRRDAINAALVPGGGVSGTVTTTNGTPVARICAGVIDAAGELLAAAATNADGRVRVDGIRPGTHHVLFVDCAPELRYGQVWFRDAVAWEMADAITVRAFEVTSGIDAVLTPLSGAGAPSLDDGELPLVLEACPADLVPSSGFKDVGGNVHEAAIDCVTWRSIARGVAEDRYAPDNTVRRDQMASFLARLMEALGFALPHPTDQGFTDVDGNAHVDRINQLAAMGVTLGSTATTYAPNVPVRRDQMATFLVRTLEAASDREMPASGPSFTDTAGNVHEPSIDKVAEAGITLGTGDGSRYEPAGEVRRDQMASFLARTLHTATGGLDAAVATDADEVQGASWPTANAHASCVIGGRYRWAGVDSGTVWVYDHQRYAYRTVLLQRWFGRLGWQSVDLRVDNPWSFTSFGNLDRGFYRVFVYGRNHSAQGLQRLWPVRYQRIAFQTPQGSNYSWCDLRW